MANGKLASGKMQWKMKPELALCSFASCILPFYTPLTKFD